MKLIENKLILLYDFQNSRFDSKVVNVIRSFLVHRKDFFLIFYDTFLCQDFYVTLASVTMARGRG